MQPTIHHKLIHFIEKYQASLAAYTQSLIPTKQKGVTAVKMSTSITILLISFSCTSCSMDPRVLETAAKNKTEPFGIAHAGSFHIGGELVAVQSAGIFGKDSGTVWAHQLQVSYYLPDTKRPKTPVVMMPGFGLAKEVYIETPDGREGWAIQFLRAGHPVYLIEPANSLRAGINPEAINAQLQGRDGGSGVIFTWTRELAYPRFGLGPMVDELFDDSQMPVNTDYELSTFFSPVHVIQTEGKAMIMDGLSSNLSGLHELSARIGPAILLVHSATGVPGFAFAEKNSEQVKAVINIEPVGCPAARISNFPDTPVLSMFTDHMEIRPQMPARQEECQVVVDAMQARGIPSKMLALPAMGIHGNSHLPMLELNSAELANLLLDWIEDNNL
jgi:hypothetical protein